MNIRRVFRDLNGYIPLPLYAIVKSLYFGRKKTVSQVGQDFWVFGEVFNEKSGGYFLEIGSADGVTINNTFLLEKRYHWHGICIEANPLLFKELNTIRNVICLNVCVDSKEGEVLFAANDVFGGISDDDTDNKLEKTGINETPLELIRMKTRPLVSILKDAQAPKIIDYLSIDVEGAEERILCEFPFDEYRFNCITIERPKDKLREIFDRNGYILIKEIPNLDSFYVHESFIADYQKNTYSFWEKYKHYNIRK